VPVSGARTGSNRNGNDNRFRGSVGAQISAVSSRLLPFTPLSPHAFPCPFLFFPLPPRRIISNMARGKKGANGNGPAAAAEPSSDSTATPPPCSILPITPTPSKDRDVVKVNNSSLVELKNALDDAIKRVRSIVLPAALSLNTALSLCHHSSFPDPNSSSKFTTTPTYALL
jgi:hypothetical protein